MPTDAHNSTRSPLTQRVLDKLSCQAPNCTHDRHDGLVLRGRCHKAPTVARYRAGIVEVSCQHCDKWIADVALHPGECAALDEQLVCREPRCAEPPENHNLVFRAQCHRDAGVFVTYQQGHLLITCAACAAHVGTHHVAAGTAPEERN